MTGCDKFMVEKDVIKLFRKHCGKDEIPLKGIAKKRGTNYAFLEFDNAEQKKEFGELFVLIPKKQYKLKEVHTKLVKKFWQVRDKQSMLDHSEKVKEARQAAITVEDVIQVMKGTSMIEQVTPYYNVSYKD